MSYRRRPPCSGFFKFPLTVLNTGSLRGPASGRKERLVRNDLRSRDRENGRPFACPRGEHGQPSFHVGVTVEKPFPILPVRVGLDHPEAGRPAEPWPSPEQLAAEAGVDLPF